MAPLISLGFGAASEVASSVLYDIVRIVYRTWLIRENSTCDVGSRDGIAMSTLLVTILVLSSVRVSARSPIESLHDVRANLLGALAGAFIALFKAAAPDDRLCPELLQSPLFVFVVVSILFGTPLLLVRQGNEIELWLARQNRLVFAALVAFGVGAIVQILGELLWVGWTSWGAEKFRVAPWGTVLAAGVVATALLDPALQRQTWEAIGQVRRSIWSCTYLVLAVAGTVASGLLFPPQDVTASKGAVVACLLFLTPLIAVPLRLWIGARWSPRTAALFVVLAAGLAGGVVAYLVDVAVAPSGRSSLSEAPLAFVVAHALAAAAAAAVALSTHHRRHGPATSAAGPVASAAA